ncbi:hypothetical protein Y695_04582 [Hydrogenophaga sp. T4]|nr:hypothetical protein Y695_04582 [Hydrogenophaga sp. T4]
MDHAFAGRHPLHAAVLQQAFVTRAIAVQHAARDHVGDGLEAAVRVVGETGDVVVGVVAAEGIEHQERVEPALQVLREHAGEFHARAVGRGLPRDQPLDTAWLMDAGGW